MQIKSLFLTALFIVVATLMVTAQDGKARIANTKTKNVNNTMVITYDILNSLPTDLFKIWVEIKTSSGLVINTKSLSGDVGESVKGGIGKQIIWDIEADNLKVFDTFMVKVYGLPNGKSGDLISKKEISSVDRPKVDASLYANSETVNLKYIGTGKALFLSTILPGLGASKIDNNKPYWLLGAAGFACLGASYYMNMEAVSNYDAYTLSTDRLEREQLTGKWENQRRTSKTLAYSAAGVWVVGWIWTASLSAKAKKYDVGYFPINQNLDMTPVVSVGQNGYSGLALRYTIGGR